MPPAPIRRPLTITTWLLMSSAAIALSPLILAAGAIAAALTGRPQPRVLARLVLQYFIRELAVLLACGGLWTLSGCGVWIDTPRFRRAHYRLLHWFVHGLAARAREILSIEVDPDPSPEAVTSLQRDAPLLCFSRHAGPGDTLLIVDELMSRYHRLPSIVFKDSLSLDPSVDLLGHRLPHAVLDRSDADECEARIRQVASTLSPRGVLLLFPEGGNLTAQRRRRSIATLWRKGHRREAAAGEQMQHVMPPHPTGALCALAGNPRADVIFAAHTGLGLAAFPRELWRDAPFHRTLHTRMWRVAPDERPAGEDAQTQWLYEWWQRIDRWLAEAGEDAPTSS